mmetsp:Transcript_14803/g.40668  ORF Transcript_14803/g.40668 Transcript_14803/m.40668 type:complete len:248 (+) Transcript_14803:116-859(+)
MCPILSGRPRLRMPTPASHHFRGCLGLCDSPVACCRAPARRKLLRPLLAHHFWSTRRSFFGQGLVCQLHCPVMCASPGLRMPTIRGPAGHESLRRAALLPCRFLERCQATRVILCLTLRLPLRIFLPRGTGGPPSLSCLNCGLHSRWLRTTCAAATQIAPITKQVHPTSVDLARVTSLGAHSAESGGCCFRRAWQRLAIHVTFESVKVQWRQLALLCCSFSSGATSMWSMAGRMLCDRSWMTGQWRS